MSQSTTITVVGNVVNTPVRKDVGDSAVVEFRIAVNDSRVDPSTGKWVERTSFFKVSAWRHLGANVAESLRKGDRVLVHGYLKVREYRTERDEPRISVEISATNVGMDLTYGYARFTKVRRSDDGVVEIPRMPADPMVTAENPFADDEPPAEDLGLEAGDASDLNHDSVSGTRELVEAPF